MKINQKIRQRLREYNVNLSDGIVYLLSIYFNEKPSYIPDRVKRQVLATGILSRELIGDGYKWIIPLFEGQANDFTWVKDYIYLFKEAVGKAGYFTETKERIKKLFAENPDITKEEVLEATKRYLMSNTDKRYIRKPHYFISKGKGVDRIQDILSWIEVYRDEVEAEENREGVKNMLQ